MRNSPKIDIAELNLACAAGLPGTDKIDGKAIRSKLDRWADLVAEDTARYITNYERDPGHFNHSVAQYSMEMMITVLMLDLGVRYHPERIRNVDFARPEDLFLHGLVEGDGGTCCSLPVLYVAIGRRLGYPLKLVEGPEHLFLRWDDPRHRRAVQHRRDQPRLRFRAGLALRDMAPTDRSRGAQAGLLPEVADTTRGAGGLHHDPRPRPVRPRPGR